MAYNLLELKLMGHWVFIPFFNKFYHGRSNKFMNIVKRTGEVVPFDHNKVSAVIKKAFDANQIEVTDDILTVMTFNAIAEAQKVMKTTGKPLHVEMMQDSVEKTLMKYGFTDIAKAYILYRKERAKIRNTKLDVSKVVEGYVKRDDWRVKENSTVNYSVGGFILSNSGAITANYWLDHYYDEEIADAHRNCDIHIHDLSFLGPYCAGWSLKQLILEGLGGVPGKISSKPSKHLHTLCNQMVNFLGITQNEWAGAQAFSSFDTYLAPFVKVDNLSYEQVKQCIQSFIFGVNTPSRWGCVDTETEVLTTDGFKKYNELKKGDMIYSWDHGLLVINPVNEIVIKEYKGDMHSYHAPGYHQFVSPDHRMLIWDNKAQCYTIKHSNEVFMKTYVNFPVRFQSATIKSYNEKRYSQEELNKIVASALWDSNVDERILTLNTVDSLYVLNKWMSSSDGYVGNQERIDTMQHLALRCGLTSYVIDVTGYKQVKLNLSKKPIDNIAQSKVEYDGIIWCPNVDAGTAVFRKDGCVFISGQCQAPFTNVTIDWNCPDDLRDIPAIVGGVPQDFTYGDCKKEMDMVNKAFIEVMVEGDADGRGFQYPIKIDGRVACYREVA